MARNEIDAVMSYLWRDAKSRGRLGDHCTVAPYIRRKLRAIAIEAFRFGLSHYKTTGEVDFEKRFGVKLKYPYHKRPAGSRP